MAARTPRTIEAVMSTNSVMCLNTVQQLTEHGISLQETIGLGTYGKVKKALLQDSTSGEQREVAVKIIDRRRASTAYVRSFLPREVQMVKLLQHPNVVNTIRVLDIDHVNVCIVTEFAENGNLLQMIRAQKRVPDNMARHYFRHLFEALFYMHERLHMIHRDLKCENILFDAFWNVKLADFGFARIMSATDPPSYNFCGSRAYSAPEILAHKAYSGFASDMWSAGVVLYIALTGHMPYNDKDGHAQLKQQREHKIHYHYQIEADAKQLIYDLLEPLPDNRPKYEQVVQSAWLKDTPWEYRLQDTVYRKVAREVAGHVQTNQDEGAKAEKENEPTMKETE